MKKVRDIFGKKGFGKGAFRFMNCLLARFSAGWGKDGRSRLFSRLTEMFSTAGAGAREMRPGRSGQSDCRERFLFSPAAPKKFGCTTALQIGSSPTRAPSPRRWAMPSGISFQSGRSMIEMLAVLAIVGVLSVAALVGFTYAMNKHRANETIYDVMLRGTNVPMVDENYASKPSGHEFRFPDLPAGTYYPMTTKKDAGSSYYVEATGVTYRVCELILKMNPTDIDQIVVGNSVYQGDSDICGTNDGLAMKFCFGSDGTICDGTGQGGFGSGGSSGGSGSGDPDPDPTPCTLSKDCTGTMVCINGFCQEPDPDTPCVEDTDCPGDLVCTSGICQDPISCTDDTDCPDNQICVEGLCQESCPDGYLPTIGTTEEETICCSCQEALIPFEYSGNGTFCTEHNRWVRVTRNGNTLSLEGDNGWMKGDPEPNYVVATQLGMVNQYDDALYPSSAGYCREGRKTLWSHNFEDAENLLFVAPFTVQLGGQGCETTTVSLPGTEGWMKAGVCPAMGAQTASITYDISGSYVGYKPSRLDAGDVTGYTCAQQGTATYQCVKGN